MRWYIKVFIVAVLGFLAIDLASGQIPGGLGGFGRGGASPDPLSLLRNDSVKKELKLTNDQSDKVNEAVWEALAKVLDPEQLKRLKQIDLQQRGDRAFTDAGLQKALNIKDKQIEDIKAILSDGDKDMQDVMLEAKKGGAAGFQAMQEKIAAIRKETKERITSVLDAEQRRIYQEMLGDDFKIEFPKLPVDPGTDKKGKGKKGGG